VDGTRCPRGGLREFLVTNQLTDTKFLEELGQHGLVEVEKRLSSYRAVLSSIKQRKKFPVNKPDTHGARILQAWLARSGKHHRAGLMDSRGDASMEPPTKRARLVVEDEVRAGDSQTTQPQEEKEETTSDLADELRPCIESLKCRSCLDVWMI
jgi:hypothetical protein